MGRKKYLAKNIVFLTIGQFGTKLLGFFLVPLYTSILSTQDYGIYDLMIASIRILLPVLTINISQSVLRFSLEEGADKKEIFSIGCRFLLFSNLFILIFIIINHFIGFVPIVDQYFQYFILIYFVQSSSEIMTTFTKGINKVADLSVSGVICACGIIISNIFCLCVLKMGLDGYFIANIVGPLFQIVYLIFRTKAWKFCNIKFINKKLQYEMVQYSLPLIANSIAWWINSFTDRYIVTFFCGLASNGIYSVASKIPGILNTFQGIFNQVWVLSAVKEFTSDDENGFYSQTYNMYEAIMILTCTGIIVINRFLAKVMYAKDFYSAWQYVPFLLISIVFGAMSGYIGGIFQAVKNSKIFAQSTVIGAVVNIVLNIIFVPLIGALGAAIATAISYGIVFMIRIKNVKRYINLNIKISRAIWAYSLMAVQGVLFLLYREESLQLYLYQTLIMCIQLFCYKNEIIVIYKTFSSYIKHR